MLQGRWAEPGLRRGAESSHQLCLLLSLPYVWKIQSRQLLPRPPKTCVIPLWEARHGHQPGLQLPGPSLSSSRLSSRRRKPDGAERPGRFSKSGSPVSEEKSGPWCLLPAGSSRQDNTEGMESPPLAAGARHWDPSPWVALSELSPRAWTVSLSVKREEQQHLSCLLHQICVRSLRM